MKFRIWMATLLMVFSTACATDDFEGEPTPHEEDSDLIVTADSAGKGDELSATFDKNFILSDTFFEDVQAVDGNDVQAFLEDSPYGNRSWLADERVNGVRAADLIVQAARAENINPILLLVRLQVEQALVSKTARPSQTRINAALGCGCPDGRSCMAAYRGFDKQMTCGAEVHRKLFNASKDGGDWSKGKRKRSLDPSWITPTNHATAALYGYTPWVLTGRGGNWLVWNVSKKFIKHFSELGHYHTRPTPWVGTACTTDLDCGFADDGQLGFCHDFVDTDGVTQGFCTLMCEGFCPDLQNKAPTFCVEVVSGQGLCVSKADELNESCGEIAGTQATERDRFVGTSNASASTSLVCVP